METQKTQLKGILILLLTAIIWGTSFVSQSVGMESVEAFTFNGIRTLIGSFVLLPFIVMRDKISERKMTKEQIAERKKNDLKTIRRGIILGVVLCAATNFQQFAFLYSTAGKIAFITAMYMIFVPIAEVIIGRKIPFITWLCVAAGFAGLFLLCMNPENMTRINKGDFLTLICAAIFTIQIMLVSRFSPKCDGLKLSFTQFFTSGIISFILMLIFETPSVKGILAAALPILYSGVMSCALAYTFQIIGQKYCEATIASLLMCMESVFAVISAAIILGEKMSGRELAGCAIMFAAIIISQLGEKILERPQKKAA